MLSGRTVAALAIHLALCFASIVHAQARIVGAAAHAFNDGSRVYIALENGDYYRGEAGTWTLLGNMLSSSGRAGERVVGLTASTYGSTYDYLWGITDTGYLCSCYTSNPCNCLGINGQSIFEVAGRPSDEVVAIGTNALHRLYATTRNGEVFEIFLVDYAVTYLGNAFGTPAAVPFTPVGEGVSIAPPAPNPWRAGSGRVNLVVSVPMRMLVDVAVFDALGRRVASIYRGWLNAGAHDFPWNGNLDDGMPALAGLYLLKLSATGVTRSQRLALVR